MSIETTHDSEQRHWLVERDRATGTQHVTVAAQIEFEYDKEGAPIGSPQIVVAGGRVAVDGVVTLDQLLNKTTYVYEEVVSDDEVHAVVAEPGAHTGAVIPVLSPPQQAVGA